MKGIYVGPPHFWHRYALNPRERYYYGYYGMYGPYTDISQYEPINEEFRLTDGCYNNESLLSGIVGGFMGGTLGTTGFFVVMIIIIAILYKLLTWKRM